MKKYITLSFDDGVEQDKKIIHILRSYGLKGCTFNLNAGLFGESCTFDHAGEGGLTHTVHHHRIPADEIEQVYAGFEIAAHAYQHECLPELSQESLDACIRDDVAALSTLAGYPIRGFAYPYGVTSPDAISVLKKYGIRYARTVASTYDFCLPTDPYLLHPTCHIRDERLEEVLRRFFMLEEIEHHNDMHSPKRHMPTRAIAPDNVKVAPSAAASTAADRQLTPTGEEIALCYIWGHGYEFDYNTPHNNWDRLKWLCEQICAQDDVICCTPTQKVLP